MNSPSQLDSFETALLAELRREVAEHPAIAPVPAPARRPRRRLRLAAVGAAGGRRVSGRRSSASARPAAPRRTPSTRTAPATSSSPCTGSTTPPVSRRRCAPRASTPTSATTPTASARRSGSARTGSHCPGRDPVAARRRQPGRPDDGHGGARRGRVGRRCPPRHARAAPVRRCEPRRWAHVRPVRPRRRPGDADPAGQRLGAQDPGRAHRSRTGTSRSGPTSTGALSVMYAGDDARSIAAWSR